MSTHNIIMVLRRNKKNMMLILSGAMHVILLIDLCSRLWTTKQVTDGSCHATEKPPFLAKQTSHAMRKPIFWAYVIQLGKNQGPVVQN